MNKAIFLDRDGVLNIDKGYVYKWESFQLIEGTIEALKRIQILNFKIIIITNQSGIARGYYTESDYKSLTKTFINYLNLKNIYIDGIYHCPHHPFFSKGENSHCNCRKPKPGLFLKAAKENNINISESIAIGDKHTDLIAAKEAGIKKRYLIKKNNNQNDRKDKLFLASFDNLLECVKSLS